MPNSDVIKLNFPVKKARVNGPITKNIESLLRPLVANYNEQQKKYSDDRSPGILGIHQYGYEIVGAHAGFKKSEGGGVVISVNFRVKPMPCAFDGNPDHGMSEEACRAVAVDIEKALFTLARSMQERKKYSEDMSEKKTLEFLIQNGRDEDRDLSKFLVSLQVHLDGFSEYSPDKPRFSCSIPLGGSGK
jgi:hypothetical protein